MGTLVSGLGVLEMLLADVAVVSLFLSLHCNINVYTSFSNTLSNKGSSGIKYI